jgi:hypothetical protein
MTVRRALSNDGVNPFHTKPRKRAKKLPAKTEAELNFFAAFNEKISSLRHKIYLSREAIFDGPLNVN